MNTISSLTPTHPLPGVMTVAPAIFGDLYFSLLRPDVNGKERLRKVRAAATAYTPGTPGSGASLEQLFSDLLGRPVRLSESQFQAFKLLSQKESFAELSPWSEPRPHEEREEMVSASDLELLYRALLKPDGGLVKRIKAVQAAVALYEPGIPGSQDALLQELSQLIGKPVQLSEVQLRCFKELLVDEPAFAHIAPWEDLTASW